MYLPLSVCAYCLGDVDGGRLSTCENNRYVRYPNDEMLFSVPFMPENFLLEQACPDCHVRIGGFHHPGCSLEICPRCGGRLLTCGCLETNHN